MGSANRSLLNVAGPTPPSSKTAATRNGMLNFASRAEVTLRRHATSRANAIRLHSRAADSVWIQFLFCRGQAQDRINGCESTATTSVRLEGHFLEDVRHAEVVETTLPWHLGGHPGTEPSRAIQRRRRTSDAICGREGRDDAGHSCVPARERFAVRVAFVRLPCSRGHRGGGIEGVRVI